MTYVRSWHRHDDIRPQLSSWWINIFYVPQVFLTYNFLPERVPSLPGISLASQVPPEKRIFLWFFEGTSSGFSFFQWLFCFFSSFCPISFPFTFFFFRFFRVFFSIWFLFRFCFDYFYVYFSSFFPDFFLMFPPPNFWFLWVFYLCVSHTWYTYIGVHEYHVRQSDVVPPPSAHIKTAPKPREPQHVTQHLPRAQHSAISPAQGSKARTTCRSKRDNAEEASRQGLPRTSMSACTCYYIFAAFAIRQCAAWASTWSPIFRILTLPAKENQGEHKEKRKLRNVELPHYRRTPTKAHRGDKFLTLENIMTGCAFVGGGGVERTPGDEHLAREPRSWGVITRGCDNTTLLANECEHTPARLRGVCYRGRANKRVC